MEAIGILEELLKIKKVNYGTNSNEFSKSCKQLCEICNILAVYYLKKEDVNSALDLLRKSEELVEANELGQAMTCNNMACYYRRIGKMKAALGFLQQALTIEAKLQRPEIQADTHLNICAVLSQLNKHELALNHAMSAVILLQEMMLARKLEPQAYPYDEDAEDEALPETNKDRTAVLAIAYHNMGVEQEFLKSFPAAILSYKKAVNFAEKNLGPEDSITQNLRNVFENAKVEVSSPPLTLPVARSITVQERRQEGTEGPKGQEEGCRPAGVRGDAHAQKRCQHGKGRGRGRGQLIWVHLRFI